MKKLMVFVLIALAVSGVFAGGGAQQQEGGVVTLNHFGNYLGYPDRYLFNIDGRVQKIVEQKTGVRINSTYAATAEEGTLMIASGEIPDLITVGYESAQFHVLAPSNMVLDFMPIVREKYMDWYNYMGEGFWNFYQSSNGKNNFFPNWAFYPNAATKYAAIGVWNQVLIQRTDIFEATGRPDLSTPEKLLAHLLDVKAKYPNIKAHLSRPVTTLPFVGSAAGSGFDMFKMMYGIEGYYTAPDGTVKGSYQHPKYRDFIIYLNRMFREGLIAREDLAATAEQYLASYDRGDFYMTVHGVSEVRYPPTARPDLPYQAAQVWDTMIGAQQNGIAGHATFVSSKTRYPEQAVGFLAYITMLEGDRLNQWGEQGKDYEFNATGGPEYTQWYLDQTKNNQREYFLDKGMFMWAMNWADHEWVTLNVPGELPYMRQIRDTIQDHMFVRLNYLSLNPAGNIPEAITYTQLNDLWIQEIPQIIMADSEAAALARFDALKASFDSMGIASVEKYWTMRSNRILDAFGAENCILWGADNALYHKTVGTPAPTTVPAN